MYHNGQCEKWPNLITVVQFFGHLPETWDWVMCTSDVWKGGKDGWGSSFKVKIVFVLKEVWPEIKSFHDNHLSCIKSSNAISKYAPNALHYFRKKSDYMNYFILLVWIQHKNYLYDFRNFWAMKKFSEWSQYGTVHWYT